MRCPQPTGEEALLAPSPGMSQPMPGEGFTRVFVTIDAALVILLAFAFGFGNGWTTALYVGVNPWIAPLVQPAVDLAVVGLMIAIRYLAIHGWTDAELTKPRWWMRIFGAMTLAMNVTLPLLERHYGRGIWDAIGPVLLVAWSELAPWLLRAIYSVRQESVTTVPDAHIPHSLVLPPSEDAVPPAPEEVESPTPEEVEPQAPEEAREEEKVAAEEPRKAAVIDISSGNLRKIVRGFCLEWSQQGNPYAGVISAVYKLIHPMYLRQGQDVTRRRIGQLCQEEWDDLHKGGDITTPRAA